MRILLVIFLFLLPVGCSENSQVIVIRPSGIQAEVWDECVNLVDRIFLMNWNKIPLEQSKKMAPLRGPLKKYMETTSIGEASEDLTYLDNKCIKERLRTACGVFKIVTSSDDLLERLGNRQDADQFQDSMEKRYAAGCKESDSIVREAVIHYWALQMANGRWISCD